MSRRVHWTARGAGIDLNGSSVPGVRDVTPVTAVLRDLEQILDAQLTGLGFSGASRPGVRSYSATFARPGTQWLGCIVTLSDEQSAVTSHPRETATA